MGYRTCVDCSTEKKWGVVSVVYHKTGNTVEVVKDPEVAARVNAMSMRTGFGVLKGMTGNYAKLNSGPAKPVETLPEKPITDRVLSRKPIETDWVRVGEEATEIAESYGIEAAEHHLQKARDEKRIYRLDHERLLEIIKHINNERTI
jgi:hypothetical protein